MNAQQSSYIVIPSEQINACVASQHNSNWCWAACLQMIYRYYGFSISQENIVSRSYGRDAYGQLPNWTGSYEVITSNLNGYQQDDQGRPFTSSARLNWGCIPASLLVSELQQKHPLLIGYRSSWNSSHAVLITACRYHSSPYGPMIESLVLRDPWPSAENQASNGRREVSGSEMSQLMEAYWTIRLN